MKNYLKLVIKLSSVAIFFSMPLLSMAQVNPGCDPAVDPTCVPIDGGLSFLIAAGIGYGIKKIKDKRKKELPTI